MTMAEELNQEVYTTPVTEVEAEAVTEVEAEAVTEVEAEAVTEVEAEVINPSEPLTPEEYYKKQFKDAENSATE